ncbi:hypothetical protein X975_26178, partial [Stegodyphus mimosarum]
MSNLAEKEVEISYLIHKEVQTLDAGEKETQMPDSSSLTVFMLLSPVVNEEANQLSTAVVKEVKQLSTAAVEEVKQLSTAVIKEVKQLSSSVEKEIKRVSTTFEEAISRLCTSVEKAAEQLSLVAEEVKRLPTADKSGESSTTPPSIEVGESFLHTQSYNTNRVLKSP